VDDCDDEHVESTSHSEKDDCSGGCSPFFTCGTCTGFTYETPVLTFDAVITHEDKSFLDLSILLYSEYTSSFFQPPKMS
jgi:hypothetical protein